MITCGAVQRPIPTGPATDNLYIWTPVMDSVLPRSHITGEWGYCSADCVTKLARSQTPVSPYNFFYILFLIQSWWSPVQPGQRALQPQVGGRDLQAVRGRALPHLQPGECLRLRSEGTTLLQLRSSQYSSSHLVIEESYFLQGRRAVVTTKTSRTAIRSSCTRKASFGPE